MSIGVLDKDGAPQTISTVDDLLAVLPTSRGTKTGALSLSVVTASDDPLIGYLDGVETAIAATNTAIGTMSGKLPAALGQTTKSASLSVALASNDDSLALLGAVNETAPGTDTASVGLNGRLQRIAQRLTSLLALFPATLGQTTKAASLSVSLASNDDILTLIGATSETAATSDTATAGLNGYLKRITAKLTALIAQLPASLGIKTAAASLSIAPASDAVFPVIGTTKSIKQQCTTDTAAYASGDVLVTTVAVALARANDAGGTIQAVTIVDKDDLKMAFSIYILRANNSMGTINAAPSISDANAEDIIGIIEVSTGDYKDLGGVSVAHIRGLSIPFVPATGTQNVYMAIVNGTGAPTYTASGLVINWSVLQD